jgi:hypothetical protein
MLAIHASCEYGKDASGYVDYVKTNIAGFVKVADAMLAQSGLILFIILERAFRFRLEGFLLTTKPILSFVVSL